MSFGKHVIYSLEVMKAVACMVIKRYISMLQAQSILVLIIALL